jgi:hypothetical protein
MKFSHKGFTLNTAGKWNGYCKSITFLEKIGFWILDTGGWICALYLIFG